MTITMMIQFNKSSNYKNTT